MQPSPAPVRSRMRGARTGTGKAGQDRALGPMPVAPQPLAAVFGLSVSVAAKEGCDLRLDGLRQQRPRTLAQNFGERVGELCWLDQLDDIILGHGVSLLRWRSGGSNTPTIRRLNPSRRHQLPRIPPTPPPCCRPPPPKPPEPTLQTSSRRPRSRSSPQGQIPLPVNFSSLYNPDLFRRRALRTCLSSPLTKSARSDSI